MQSEPAEISSILGVDIGGTFTDIVYYIPPLTADSTGQLIAPARVTLLTDRRKRAPYGLFGGEPGAVGMNALERDGTVTQLPGKVTFDVKVGDILSIYTPGGGGFSLKEQVNNYGN